MINPQLPIRILLIEDSPSDQDIFKEMIKDTCFASSNLVTVERIKQGLTILTQESEDILILDLSLPDCLKLDGLIKIKQHYPALPVIILTGLSDVSVAMQSIHAGAQDYLVKGEYNHQLLEKSMLYAIERQKNIIALQQQEQQLRKKQQIINQQNKLLEIKIEEKTADLKLANQKLKR